MGCLSTACAPDMMPYPVHSLVPKQVLGHQRNSQLAALQRWISLTQRQYLLPEQRRWACPNSKLPRSMPRDGLPT
eukprot:4060233-Amphidinium_carterae.1